MKLQWTPRAFWNLKRLHMHIVRDNPSAANTVLNRLLRVAEALKSHPNMGKIGRIQGTRELVVLRTGYILVCRVVDETVEVITVQHIARNK